jgi:hypothetical protein
MAFVCLLPVRSCARAVRNPGLSMVVFSHAYNPYIGLFRFFAPLGLLNFG